MQDQKAVPHEPTGVIVQTRTRGRFEKLNSHRIILVTVVCLGLLVAGIFAILALTGVQSSSETRELSPISASQEDPPLPARWVDPYSQQLLVIPITEDPQLPDGWIDPYFKRYAVLPDAEDPPLPAGWIDPYFRQSD